MKNSLHQYHIKNGAACNTQKHILFPQMQCHNCQNSNRFRDSKGSAAGLNADTNRDAVTNSMEPAKINILIKKGYQAEKPLLLIRNP